MKFNRKITTIIGTATLAVGLMAFPVLAQTTGQQGNGWFGQMRNAMQTGDVKAMQDIMNSDPAIKAQIGQDNLDKMNQFMNNSGGNMMTNSGSMTGSQGTMKNGSGTSNKGNNMMGSSRGMMNY